MNIPIGQQVHAFVELWKKQPRRGRPKLHDYLDEMMPGTNKRTRQRHLKVFAVVSSDDWPDMVALAQEAITGMELILWVDRAFSPPPPRKKKTPEGTLSDPPRRGAIGELHGSAAID